MSDSTVKVDSFAISDATDETFKDVSDVAVVFRALLSEI